MNGSFVLGFDHDRPDVFAKTADWIEQNRLECATFHILTPYPGTPLFAQMESEGRILHKDWSQYDTGHVVFRPKLMTADELAEGYAWCYRRLFSHRSIWLPPAARPLGDHGVSGDVVSLQAIESALALFDQQSIDRNGLATARGMQPAAAFAVSCPAGGAGRGRPFDERNSCVSRRLTTDADDGGTCIANQFFVFASLAS